MADGVPKNGPVAQLGARFHGMEEVVGSIPTRSTKSLNGLIPITFRSQTLIPEISYLCCLLLIFEGARIRAGSRWWILKLLTL